MSKYKQLDAEKLGPSSEALRTHLLERVIGQSEACYTVVGALSPYFAGINQPNKPLCTLLFLGSTGIGKTFCCEEIARHVCGTADAVTRIACETLKESHAMYSLIGAPPSYVGYNDMPMLAQAKLNKWRKNRVTSEEVVPLTKPQLSVLLFDEIDKASYSVLQLLLGILETGHLTLSDGDITDFTQTIIVLTANWGGRAISEANTGDSMGFMGTHARPDTDALAISEAHKAMSPELQNRLDKIVVFKTLDDKAIREICELEIGKVQKTIRESEQGFLFSVSDRAQIALCKEGTSPKYGARELKRVINRRITQKLANLITSGQVDRGIVKVDYLRGRYVFLLRNIVMPVVRQDDPQSVSEFIDKQEPILCDAYGDFPLGI